MNGAPASLSRSSTDKDAREEGQTKPENDTPPKRRETAKAKPSEPEENGKSEAGENGKPAAPEENGKLTAPQENGKSAAVKKR